ncbi:MAG: rhomboid family intramembrane serine protease [Actinomycetota bacterium]
MVSLIPISDANPTKRVPFITLALIALNIVAFFMTPGLGQNDASTVYFIEEAPLPCQLEDSCPTGPLGTFEGETVRIPERTTTSFLWSVVLGTFLHAGWLHIAGNMLFLWVFGNNVEDYLGHVKYLLFYLAGGLVASFAHILTHMDDAIPIVGASGAVAAVMGAYLLLFPRARVKVLVPIFILWTIIELQALAVLGLWFVYQFIIAAQEASGATSVAWMAHVGGFVFGVLLVFVLGGRPHKPQPAWQPGWRY